MERNILLCGFGAFGQQHAAAWRSVSPKSRLLLADTNPKARNLALKMGFAEEDICGNYKDLICKADIVDIATASDSHYSIAVESLRSKIPTLIEKPAVKVLNEAKILCELSENNCPPVQIQFLLRAHPLVIESKKILKSGEIGRLLALDGIFTGWKRMRPDSNILENDGVHMLDLMRFFVGVKPDKFDVVGDKLLGGRVPETIHLRLDYPKQVKGYLRLGILFGGKQSDPYLAGSLTKKQLTLMGDKGSIELDFNENTMEVTNVEYKKTIGGFTPSVNGVRARRCPNITPVTLLEQCFENFLMAIERKAPVMCDLKEGAVEITELLETAGAYLAT